MHHKAKAFFLICSLWLMVILLSISCFSLIRDGLYLQQKEALPEYDYADLQFQIPITAQDSIAPPEFDADALKTENPDFKGWLQIPDTVISFPVVQGTDNSYYLKHSFQRHSSAYGCPFLEYTATDADRSLVIHGHNMGMNREEMFSSLVNYQDQTFADDHNIIFYADPNRAGKERYTVFAVLNLSVNNSEGFQYRQQQFSDEAAFQAYVSYLKDHSIYQSDYTPSGTLLILSTCNRAYGNDNRLLVCAGRDL